ncbi:MAG: hypothetical protein CENE_00972 [Candidatus Celerinatantimonas neptuna]|nr:MAG: hypothetical protein CENE_00972 [Candidatus Celerinatantimonas neptuna]
MLLGIFAYAMSIMYTPGPVNLIGLHGGLNGKTRAHLGFFAGVACAMFIFFMAFGFLGVTVIPHALLPYISLGGSGYILYVAWGMAKKEIRVGELPEQLQLSFWDGLFVQLLNPKAFIVTLPITTIQFPAAGVAGSSVMLWSLVFTVFAFCAPGSYSLVGRWVGKRIENPVYFRVFNWVMAWVLVFVAIDIGYEYGYLKLN